MSNSLLGRSLGPTRQTQVVTDERVLGGQPVLSGTRIPAATILAYLRGGYSAADIHEDYPALPSDGIPAVEAWAVREFGSEWKLVGHTKSD